MVCISNWLSGFPLYLSSIPAIATLVVSAPSLKCLILHVHFDFCNKNFLSEVDWSPLMPLVHSSLERIELYVGTVAYSQTTVSPDELHTLLERNTDLKKLIKQGFLIIKLSNLQISL